MKRIRSIILSLSLLCSFVTSCGTANGGTYKIGDSYGWRQLVVFQTLSSSEALCREFDGVNLNYNLVFKVVSYENVLYDGQKITANWILVDTYTYLNADKENPRNKTVPVVMAQNEYKKLKQIKQ